MNYVYILRCADDTLYTGWTNDLTRRLCAHNRGASGAKYTRSRRPVRLVYCEAFAEKGEAMTREAQIKALTRAEKEVLLATMQEGECLTVLDADCQPAGDLPRRLVHQYGLRHSVVHLWLIEERAGVLGIWLQQRGFDRPLYPGLYDLAATGHVDPGETPIQGALREAREEIGIDFAPSLLLPLGSARQRYARPDGGLDDEVVHVFAARVDGPPEFHIGPEVERMRWVSLKEFDRAERGAPCLCIDGEQVPAGALCCLHKGEWRLFAKHRRRYAQ